MTTLQKCEQCDSRTFNSFIIDVGEGIQVEHVICEICYHEWVN